MDEEKEVDANLVALYLNEHGPTPLIQIARELGSLVKAVIAVERLSRRNWIQVMDQGPEKLLIVPKHRQARAHTKEGNKTRRESLSEASAN
jgi:hypothetical protein